MATSSVSGLSISCTGVLLALFSMSTSVVMRVGRSVRLNCSHGLHGDGWNSVFWLKQSNHSAPVCVLILQHENPRNNNVNFCNGFNGRLMNSTANSLISTLEIRSVSVSDSGLYYCATLTGAVNNYILFSNATYLTVTDETDDEYTETSEEGRFCNWECGTVVLVLGVLSAVLSLVLVLLILTRRYGGQNTDPGNPTPSPLAQDSDSVNYAALSFSAKKKRRRRDFNLQSDYTSVIYAATR
ncbi:uncharacterized protein LOC134060100 isoform X2 [Sardina pilchardus]|uniref:uncharacterized protein LOC134060100 isoform X2 n=1 Tax=Sardina pilchardus TaxID=27697 RepID=UPI002E147521